jgi:hypothetical protein
MPRKSRSLYRNFPTNSAYQTARAHLIRSWIFEIIGRQCAECGTTEGPMEVNHIYRREYSIKRLSVYKRTLRYWRDVQRGLCNCLCRSCNANWRPKPISMAPPVEHVDPTFTDWLERFYERNPNVRVKLYYDHRPSKLAA